MRSYEWPLHFGNQGCATFRPYNHEDCRKTTISLDAYLMTTPDEPVLGTRRSDTEQSDSSGRSVLDHIQRLIGEQPYAVLCVQGGGQPYGALIAYAFSLDLRHAVFATPKATRKYRLLGECDHVAMVIDNRPTKANELMEVEAVTVTGRSQLVERGAEFDQLAELLLNRHPYLASFLKADSCALFRVDTVRFLHVQRFQEVSQWVPTPLS
jgi:nitroimidazol reductase NimA-like FMN-containing flavoprotein (pyridoxamine 5'-phosphate oxidase superfamily)